MPVRPHALEDLVEEPLSLNEFLAIIQETFQSASALYLEDLATFIPHPRESLLKMADHFDEVAMPLLNGGLMSSQGIIESSQIYHHPHPERDYVCNAEKGQKTCQKWRRARQQG